jgi:hypothetical protein
MQSDSSAKESVEGNRIVNGRRKFRGREMRGARLTGWRDSDYNGEEILIFLA